MADMLDFIGKSPDDPEVKQAKIEHKDFRSPIGTFFWCEEENRYVVCGPYTNSFGHFGDTEFCEKKGYSRDFLSTGKDGRGPFR